MILYFLIFPQFMNDRVNAMRDYQEALRLDPRYSLAYFNAGNVYFQTRHFSQVYFDKLLYTNTYKSLPQNPDF